MCLRYVFTCVCLCMSHTYVSKKGSTYCLKDCNALPPQAPHSVYAGCQRKPIAWQPFQQHWPPRCTSNGPHWWLHPHQSTVLPTRCHWWPANQITSHQSQLSSHLSLFTACMTVLSNSTSTELRTKHPFIVQICMCIITSSSLSVHHAIYSITYICFNLAISWIVECMTLAVCYCIPERDWGVKCYIVLSICLFPHCVIEASLSEPHWLVEQCYI